jgi:multidrug efflux pump subunit AcrA (membrane-fusion protein)
MTPLGKMLAIFVFLLALVWAWLTVNTYVSRTNWKAESDRYQKQALATAEAHEKLKLQAEAERSGTKAETESMKRDRDAAIDTVARLRDELKLLKDEIDAKLTTAAKNNPDINKALIRQTELQTEVANLTGSLATAQDQVVALNKTTATAKLLQEQAQRDADAEKQRAATLENALRNTDDKVKELTARLKQGVGAGDAIRPTAPEGFRGTVSKVGSTGEFVEITPGGATGLRAGTKLVVKRLDPKNPKFVGYLIVRDEIDPDKAAAQFVLPANVTRPSAADYPQPGDVVESESK